MTDGVCETFTSFQDANVSETATATEYFYTGLPNECYQFRYTVKDVVGNTQVYTSNQTTKVTALDTTLPTSKILYPQDNANLKKVTQIIGKATDNVSVDYTRISIYDRTSGTYYNGTDFGADTETWIMTNSSAIGTLVRWSYTAPTWSE